MDEHAMTAFSHFPWQIAVPLFFAGGFLIGYGYFRALRKTTDMLLGQGSAVLVVVLTIGRMAAIVAAFYLAALAGPQALLAAFAGAMVGRALILRRRRGELR